MPHLLGALLVGCSASLESLGEAARIHRMEEFTSTAAKLLFNAREFHGAAFLFSRALHIAQQAKSVSDETVAALTNNVAAAYHGAVHPGGERCAP